MTMTVTVEQTAPGTIRLAGDLVFASVLPARQKLLGLLQQTEGECRVDWSGVQRVDSSALSLWLVCLRQATEQGVQLHIERPPADLVSIADLVGLADALA